jgi:serine/threonine-protein kinase PknK
LSAAPSPEKNGAPSARLVIRERGAERAVELDGDSIAIGRSRENQIEIDDISSSRRHCRLFHQGGSWWVEDLQSRNGTLVNGVLVRKQELAPGDCIEIGKTRIYFERIPTRELRGGGGETLVLSTEYFMEPLTDVTEESQLDLLQSEREIFLRLLEITRGLCQTLVLPDLLGMILDTVIEISNAERGFIILEEEDEELSIAISRNIDKETVRKAELKVSRSITREVLAGGRPILTGDARHDVRLTQFASVSELRLESVLCVPLSLRGRVLGVIYVDNRFETNAFHRSHLRFVEFLADQATVFIENARLFEENDRKQAQLLDSKEKVEELNRELQEMLISRELDPEKVTEVITRSGERGFKYDYDRIVTKNSRMEQIFQILDRVIETDIPVLVQGESGTGKELIADAIHYQGVRKERPFVSQNCAAIPPNLLESEFFGHVKGAFTGALKDKKGLFELADGGTLFLDEIGDMSLDLQTKLLRVVEEGEIRPVGGRDSKRVDVRLISATNRDLEEMVRTGGFREDLYYRLNVINVTLPPLRERREDVPILVEHFMVKVAERMKREKPTLDSRTLYYLYHYDWPGNVRQLENEVERMVALTSDTVTPEFLSPALVTGSNGAGGRRGEPTFQGTLKEQVAVATEKVERRVIADSLAENKWNKSQTARNLGISRPTLDQKIEKYGLKRPSPPEKDS